MQFDADEALIETERLRSVFHRAPLTLAVSVINAVVVAIVIAPFGSVTAMAWVVAIAATSLVRWRMRQYFRLHPPHPTNIRAWSRMSVAGAATTGLLWGIAAIALFPASDTLQLFLALVIGGMCAGAISVNALHLPTVVAFIIPATLPLTVRFLLQGPLGAVSALMVAIFAVAMILLSLSEHRAFGQRIRLQLALNHEQRQLAETNEQLHQEIAQRRSVEAILLQAQKMEAIGHITGGIAHDFNNLLQVIVGNLDLIQRLSRDNPRVVGYALAAGQAAQRGSDLTSSLLTFARRQALRTERININTLLQEFEPLLRRAAGGTVRVAIKPTQPMPDCMADPAHFESAILNLVINGRDAMPDGGVITITTAVATLAADDLMGNPDAKPGSFVEVTVRDTGCGMTPELLAMVCEPFFTTKAIGKGSGLGLSQVYGFVRQSGGHLALRSAPGAGTAATVWLPVTEAEDAA